MAELISFIRFEINCGIILIWNIAARCMVLEDTFGGLTTFYIS